ncbi:hypothetical protein D3C74_452180 [compost metagenome]
MHNQIKLAVLKIEFCRLEIIRQLLADRLLNYDSSGESEYRPGLGNNNVAKARKARGHASRRRVGND